MQPGQLPGTGDRFGAPLDVEFTKNLPVVPFYRIQGNKQPLANLTIREALGNEL